MYYIRDNNTGYVLAGIGSVSRAYKNVSMVWRSWRERHMAMQYKSPESARHYIDRHELYNVAIVDEAGRVVEMKEAM